MRGRGADLQTPSEITDPNGALITNPALAFEAIPGSDPAEYRVIWSGPWESPNGALPRGDYKIVVVGTHSGGTVRSEPGAPNSVVSLVEVKDIRFMGMPGTPGTRANTGPGGGDAIFPEAETPGGEVGDRDKVQVVATIDPMATDLRGQAPATVRFRGFDVDDPSATTQPVDLDGDAIPDGVSDNRMTPQSGLLRDTGGNEISGAATVEIPVSGATATTVFRVSARQGDNYRVSASTSQDWLGALRTFQPSGAGEIRHQSGRVLTQTEGDQVSAMLTAWRTLHVEIDHLDSGSVQPSDFQLRGQITKLKPQKLTDRDASFITDASDPSNDHARKDDWEGADLWPKDMAPPTAPPSGTPVKVTGNGKKDLEVVSTVDLTTMAAVDDSYGLKDDYWVDLAGGAPVAIAQRLLKEVHIDLKLLEAENATRSLSFRQYLPSFDLITLQRDVRSADIYWAIQVVNALDGPIGDRRATPPQSGDNDPDAESGVLGQTGGSGPGLQQQDPLQPVCSVLNETIRDSALEKGWVNDVPGRVTAHEVICHGMKVGHSSGSDLCFGAFDDGPAGDQLTPEQRAELRRLPQPTLN